MKTDEHLYTISRTEFAKELGKTREAVKIAMKRGKYRDLYIFKNGRYFFKSQEGVRDLQDVPLVKVYPAYKKKVNRGNHEVAVKKGNYPNQAFANHNHMKKMIALRGKMTPEELAMVPDVERMVKQERQKRLQEEYEAKLPPRDNTRGGSYSNYGSGIFNESNGGYSDPYYHSGRAHERHPSKFEASRGKTIEDSAFPYWKPKYY